MKVLFVDGRAIENDEVRKAYLLLGRLSDIPLQAAEERFMVASLIVSQLDRYMWLVLEGMRERGEEIDPAKLRKAFQTLNPEIEAAEESASRDNFDVLVKEGTIKAKTNSLLRMAVSGVRDGTPYYRRFGIE